MFGAKDDRLMRASRRQYEPDNGFRLDQKLKPAAEASGGLVSAGCGLHRRSPASRARSRTTPAVRGARQLTALS
jgi:hypothetical protein